MKIHNELTILIATAPRTTCEEILATTNDGDLRGLVQARIKVLDNIQKEAQKTIYTQTPPGMVDSWDLRDWWFENFQTLNICDIDFSAISDGKRQEWYAYQNSQVEESL
jgi:hypothetical protein